MGKVFKLVTIISVSIFFYGCENNKYVETYENGNIKLEVPLSDSLYHGKMKYYFTDGTKQGYSTWELGRLDGFSEFYYKNGVLEQRTKYKDGIPIDSAIFYRKDSSLREIQYFNEQGKMYDYKKFTQANVQDTSESSRKVMIVSEADTISMSDTFTAYLRIGNLQGQAVEAILGNYYEDSLLYARKPRLPKVDDKTVKIEHKPAKLGENTVKGLAIEVFDNPKSLVLYPFKYEYYVKPSEPVTSE